MNLNYLPFEQPIAEIEEKIKELQEVGSDEKISVTEEILKLEERSRQLTKQIFSNLKPIQVVQLARHPLRPYLQDYLPKLFTDFDELFGDRHLGKGSSIIAGLARFDGEPIVVIGHQKGRKTNEKLERNFGMARPEDYRRALRLMKLAERFHLPVFTFIDTAGAYPGIDAEEHNQSEAIARNLMEMSDLATPIIATVIGEGGSGGALGLAVGDRLLMLQYSIYSVISPEGCAAILWKDSKRAPEAAETLGLTADRLSKLGLVDEVVEEPSGGAHRDIDGMSARLKATLTRHFNEIKAYPIEQLLQRRYDRLMSYGRSST